MVIAIIPIKYHSSRVPGKNYRLMNGKPLFFYVIHTLMLCPSIENIIINIDNERLKDMINSWFSDKFTSDKIRFYYRPDHLKGDNISTNALIYDMLTTLELKNKILLQTHTTNPLVKFETFENAIKQFRNSENDSLFSVKTLQTRLYDKNGKAINHNPNELIPTQDLDPIFEENSCIYIFTYDSFVKNNHRIGLNPFIFSMSDKESQDIDYESDFRMTEHILQLETEKRKISKVVVVTGALGGIGTEICKKFKKKGWKVIGIDKINKPQYDNKNLDVYIVVDLLNIDSVNNLITNIILSVGRIDLLVNNAAIQICKNWNDFNLDDWNNTMDCNLKSAFILSRNAIPYLSERNGSIINISSVHSIVSSKEMGVYSVSKTALVGLTRSMAIELGKHGIRVNSISPGAIDTNMLKEGLKRNMDPNEARNRLKINSPIGKIGEPKDIANAVWFLNNNSFITGHNLVIDGGVSLKLSSE